MGLSPHRPTPLGCRPVFRPNSCSRQIILDGGIILFARDTLADCTKARVHARRWSSAACRARVVALLVLLCGAASATNAQPALELYGTFHSMGVTVDFASTADPDNDASAAVEYRTAGAPFRQGYPLARVSGGRFVGSLFWLSPGAAYDVRVTLTDPDAGPLNGVVLQGSQSTRAEIAIPAAASVWYVATNGSDASPGDGSLARPFATLARAFQAAHAGDHIVLRGGTYYQGEIQPASSGSAVAPIVVKSYPGESAILDGADTAAHTWQSAETGIYRTTVSAADPHLLTCDGERLFPYQTMADLRSLAWGTPGFYVENGSTVYVHLAGGANPAAHAMVISRRNYAIRITAQYHCYLGLTFRNYGCGSYAKAVYIDDGDDILFRSCIFTMNDIGIGIKRDANRNVIELCTFSDSKKDWSWDGVKTTGDLEAGAITLYSPMSGRGTVIRRNTFHNYFDGFGCAPESAGARTNETDVYENLVYDCADDGMEVDGTSSNVRIWGNTFHDVLSGVSLAPAYVGPTYAIRNVICRTGVGNNTYPGLSFKFNSGYDAGGPMYLFHNTSDAWYPGNCGLMIHSPGSWTTIVSRNNIWAGTDYSLYNANPTQPIDFDYDNLFTTQAGELAWWAGLADRHLETLAEIRTVLGLELHGKNALPGFAGAAALDYHLGEGSAMINAGVALPGINDGFEGTAPDLGAFEYHATASVGDAWRWY